MKNLSLKFLRVVNELGLNGWAQVYARVPFGEEELGEKGALFGAIFSKKENESEKEAEILVWTDEYYNAVKKAGDLAGLWKSFREKYPDVDSAWVWVSLENGRRKVRMTRKGSSGVLILRGEERGEISENSGDGVTVGEVESNDELILWAGDMEKFLPILEKKDEDNETKADEAVAKLAKEKIGAAGLMLKFGELSEDEGIKEAEKKIDKNKEKVVESKEVMGDDEEGGEEVIAKSVPGPELYSMEEKPERELIRDDDGSEMVSDRLVGPVGPKDKVANWWRRLSSRGGLMVGSGNEKKKKAAMGLGVLFLVLLIISVVIGSMRIRSDREEKRWRDFSEPIEQKITEAENLGKINLVGSKKILEEAKTSLSTGKGDFAESKYTGAVAELEQRLDRAWQEVSGEKESELLSPIDFGLIREGFGGDRLALVEDDSFLALDSRLGVVASVETDAKKMEIVAGKGAGQNWTDLTAVGKKGYVLASSGIGAVTDEVVIAPFDSAVAKPVALSAFGSNLYVLDQGNRELYRYSVSSGSIGERIRWLKQDETIDLIPVDMSIDGDIWIVGGTSEVIKFRRGVKENFSISGGPEQAKYVRVATGEKDLALLDREQGWIVIFKKEDGVFESQLKSVKFTQAEDIEFDGAGRLWVMISGMMAQVR